MRTKSGACTEAILANCRCMGGTSSQASQPAIPANAAPQGKVVAAKGLSQTVDFALGDSLAATVQT